MADAAAARREARRRRILENSHNRLQLISGKKSSEECARESPSKFPYSEQNNEFTGVSSSDSIFYNPVNNGVVVGGSESHTSLSEFQHPIAAGDSEITNDLANFMSPPSTETVKASTWEKLMSYKYDVAVLAIFNQLLYILVSYESAYFFLPLIVYTATRLIWFPTEKKNNIANVVLLLNGISTNNIQLILSMIQHVAEISQDLFVYLFVTIGIQTLLVTLKQSIFI